MTFPVTLANNKRRGWGLFTTKQPFCLLLNVYLSGIAQWHGTVSFNSLSGLFTLRGLGTWEGGGERRPLSTPTAANVRRPLYSDWKSNKQIIHLNVSLQRTSGG